MLQPVIAAPATLHCLCRFSPSPTGPISGSAPSSEWRQAGRQTRATAGTSAVAPRQRCRHQTAVAAPRCLQDHPQPSDSQCVHFIYVRSVSCASFASRCRSNRKGLCWGGALTPPPLHPPVPAGGTCSAASTSHGPSFQRAGSGYTVSEAGWGGRQAVRARSSSAHGGPGACGCLPRSPADCAAPQPCCRDGPCVLYAVRPHRGRAGGQG